MVNDLFVDVKCVGCQHQRLSSSSPPPPPVAAAHSKSKCRKLRSRCKPFGIFAGFLLNCSSVSGASWALGSNNNTHYRYSIYGAWTNKSHTQFTNLTYLRNLSILYTSVKPPIDQYASLIKIIHCVKFVNCAKSYSLKFICMIILLKCKGLCSNPNPAKLLIQNANR